MQDRKRTYGIPRKHRPYNLEEYNSEWKKWFHEYAQRIRSLVGKNLIDIEHIGSTSIEGMVAKPQIDILVTVKDLDKIKDIYDDLRRNGFTPRGREYVGIGDEYVTLDAENGKRLASIHIFQEGDPQVDEAQLFRDYLASHESEKQLYIDTKKSYTESIMIITNNTTRVKMMS